nr:sigma 54-interacting transcriptional regulator [Blautia caecimuris]
MSKIAVLLPKEYMLEQARKVLQEKNADIDILKVIKTSDSVYEARKVMEQGAGIIVARGVQAAYIREYTNIPVAEIILTGQEIALMVAAAKKLIPEKKHPQIALIGFESMFSDTSYFDELFGITLKTYFMKSMEQAAEKVELAIAEGADVLLGGDTVNSLASQRNFPSCFINSTEESIRSALAMAEHMALSAETEKTYAAQFETVLDNANNGIFEIDEKRKITIINRTVEELLKKSAEKVKGEALESFFPELDIKYVNDVLEGRRDMFTTSTYLAGIPMMITVAPVQYEEKICGAIISCYRYISAQKSSTDELHSHYLKGYVAKARFSDMRITGKEMEYCVELSRMYALSKSPVLIRGEGGTEKEFLAQCIHNNSSYKTGPFVTINCSGMSEQMQMDRIFGNPASEDIGIQKGGLAVGDLGTVLIAEIEKLTPVCQYRLYRAIRYEDLIQNDLERSQTLDNRIIATTSVDLGQLVKEGRFREDLYYLLNGLVVEIPPLRKRKEDIRSIVEECRTKFSRRYAKFPKISEDAMEALMEFPWSGNELQLETFCERMLLTTMKKTIAGDFVHFLLNELYPQTESEQEDGKTVIYQHPEAAELQTLLEKYRGNRSAVAKDMGISTTTLWRRMKKYGIINRYDLLERRQSAEKDVFK